MKHLAVVVAALALIAQPSSSATKLDSILDVTGGLQMKMIWVHWQVCNADYSPVASQDQASSLQLMGYDTKQGKEFMIDSVKGTVACYVRITWDGKWALWSDQQSQTLKIRDMECATPIRTLTTGGYYWLLAVGLDSATQTTWIYASNNSGFCKYPLSADGKSVDLTKQKIFPGYDNDYYSSVQVSGDGAYIAGASKSGSGISVLNVTANQWTDRHDSRDAFGCQPGITPDNTHRFMYLTDNHRMVRMFPPNMGTPSFEVILGGMLSGKAVLPGTTKDHDCIVPRWTNNPRYFAVAYPLTSGFIYPGDAPQTFSMSAAQIKAADPSDMPRCCIGRFGPDFKTVEKFALVSSGDIRSMDWMADAWIGGTNVAARPGGMSASAHAATRLIALRGNLVEATFAGSRPGMLTLVDSQGRTQAQASGQGTVVCALEGLAAGAYVVKAVGTDGISSKTVVISK